MQAPAAAFAILGVLAVWTAVQVVWERRELWWHLVELGLAVRRGRRDPLGRHPGRRLPRDHDAARGLAGGPRRVDRHHQGLARWPRRGRRDRAGDGRGHPVGRRRRGQQRAPRSSSSGGPWVTAPTWPGRSRPSWPAPWRRTPRTWSATGWRGTIHDGVLQALAFIHRRGVDAGGEAARLGAIAGEQEQRLRALVSGVPIDELEKTIGGSGRPQPVPAAGLGRHGRPRRSGRPRLPAPPSRERAGRRGRGRPRQRPQARRSRRARLGPRRRRRRRHRRHGPRQRRRRLRGADRRGGQPRPARGVGLDPRPARGAGRLGPVPLRTGWWHHGRDVDPQARRRE